MIIKNCAPISDCISDISNTQIDDAKENYIIMSIY